MTFSLGMLGTQAAGAAAMFVATILLLGKQPTRQQTRGRWVTHL